MTVDVLFLDQSGAEKMLGHITLVGGKLHGSTPAIQSILDSQLKHSTKSPADWYEFLRSGWSNGYAFTRSEVDSRGNPNHDKLGKFASGPGGGAPSSGLSTQQYDAITPGPGKTHAAALKSLNSTPEGKVLVSTVSDWESNMTTVSRLQRNFLKRGNGDKLNKAEDARVTALMHGIGKSPPSPPLYRGVRMPEGFSPEDSLKVGTSFILGPSSFSANEHMGKSFATTKTRGRGKNVPVVYRVETARALPIELIGASHYKHAKEYISAGQFKVTGVAKGKDGVYTVNVSHDAMFQWGA